MVLLPAIDLYEGKAVRLLRGDYEQMTVYSDDPVAYVKGIEEAGSRWLHVVDLEGARDGNTPNLPVIRRIAQETGLRIETGGGIRSLDTIAAYLDAGVSRTILGTKAVTDRAFLEEALARFGEHIAVGVDAKDGKVAIKGWKEVLDVSMFDFLAELKDLSVRTVIVTDIARDGAMKGTNLELYRKLTEQFGADGKLRIIASGGVSSYEDIRRLKETGLYGAILGKAMYTGAVDLKEALNI